MINHMLPRLFVKVTATGLKPTTTSHENAETEEHFSENS